MRMNKITFSDYYFLLIINIIPLLLMWILWNKSAWLFFTVDEINFSNDYLFQQIILSLYFSCGFCETYQLVSFFIILLNCLWELGLLFFIRIWWNSYCYMQYQSSLKTSSLLINPLKLSCPWEPTKKDRSSVISKQYYY